MGTEWNDEQRLAIETEGRDILVAAAAGSGKTTVLVERIKRLVVDEGVPASSLLVVTFTKAAAQEMKNRIRKALEDAMNSEGIGYERREYLRKQLRELPYAHISTFHSFAISVIRRFFHLIDIEPGFSVCDESKAFLLKKDALDELMESEYEAGRPEFLGLLDKYTGGRSDESLKRLISDRQGLYERLMSLPDPWGWAEDAVESLRSGRVKLKDTKFWHAYRAELIGALETAYRMERSAVDLLLENGLARIALDYVEKELKPIRTSLKRLIKNTSPYRTIADLRTMMSLQKFSGVRGRNTEAADLAPIKEQVGLYRDAAKEQVAKVKELVSEPLDRALFEMSETAVDAAELIRLTKEFDRIYTEMKAEEKVVDFTDLEHLCLKILDDREACEAYKRELSYIFIDEYQDTNMMQESIISRISKPGCTFMVGDIKQSIYRFRLADPDIFNGKYQSFTPAAEMGEGDTEVVIDMNRNYRSKAAIRRYINRTFEGLMDGYDERAALHGPDDDAEGDEPLLALVDTGEIRRGDVSDEALDEEALNELMEMKNDEIEARFAASFVRAEIEKQRFRPVDVAVLIRSNAPAQTYRKALNDCGIRCVVDENDGYFDTIEIEVFLALLNVLDNRQQDVPLITVLHSEMFGFSAEDLARIRAEQPAGSYFRAFSEYRLSGKDAELKEKCAEALALIDEWRKLARVMPLPDFIWKVMLDSGYYLFIGALPDGRRRQGNMRMLCDKAESYTAGGESSLYGFIKYVEAIRAREVRIPEAKTGGGEDAVRVMTMHKSKGLEFPMVVVTGLSRRLTYEKSGKITFHKDLGLGLRYYKEYGKDTGTLYRPTLLQKLIVDKVREEELAEQIRVLYVAMTRAKEKLILTGTVDNVEKFADRARTDLRSGSSYLNMISPHCDYRIFSIGGGTGGAPADGIPELPDDEVPELTEADGPAEGSLNTGGRAEGSGAAEASGRAEILEMLNYVYPFADARSIRSKYSVTEINKMMSPHTGSSEKGGGGQNEKLAVPSFASGKRRITAAERGTIYHSLMELLDFGEIPAKSKAGAEKYIRLMIDCFLKDGLFGKEEIDAVDPADIAEFFTDDIGMRASRAARDGRLQKERAFTMKLNARGEQVLVQGIIDCYFTEGEGEDARTVLVDYKSNRYDPGKPEEEEKRLKAAYTGQMALYRRALEAAGLPPVKEAYLYLFSAGEILDMSDTVWNDGGTDI